ncbi:aminoglycoside phosphotransferase family protein [Bacillus sp. NPDC077027]|uniref:aminoglycoside phosphotransferase family protein n=1 Tax=Bacillus sp. NPDC077027 TaxID=3390548 RepID=UPI003D071940
MKRLIHIAELSDHIPLLKRAESLTQIHKGYSHDEKYLVTMPSGEKYVLRLTDTANNEKKKTEFEVLTELRKRHVKCPQPIELGLLDKPQLSYNILSFVEGKDAKEILTHLTEKEQYQLGVSAGKDLKRMHEYPAPPDIEPWEKRVIKKHHRYLDAYKLSGMKFEGDAQIADFIAQHINIVKDRPNQFQHDDFHVGNIIVHQKQYAGAIDFNNYDWGDPIHDFYKVALFSREKSVAFSVGQINGYFADNIPKDFWLLYSVYVAMSVFSSIMWVIKFDPQQMNEMMDRLKKVVKDHEQFKQLEPIWYARY